MSLRRKLMGYVHYWDTQKNIPLKDFAAIAKDFSKLLPEFKKAGIQLAGPSGKGQVVINSGKISFNGKEHCGHTKENLGITFPATDSGAFIIYAARRPIPFRGRRNCHPPFG
jgi:hypothetical protein